MAMTNFAADGSLKSFEDAIFTTELAKGINNVLIALTALNIFLSISAFLGNALIIAALHKESSLHPPSKLLFRNLAITDLAVGIIVGPLYATFFISLLSEQWNICRVLFVSFHIISYILGPMSLLTLTAISVDRLLVLLLELRYRQVVTLNRTYITLIAFWLVCIIFSTMYLWNPYITLWFGYSVISLCLVISVFSYAKIFFTLRHNQVQAQGQQNQNVLPNRARYKKTVNSALWVQLGLVACYFPHSATAIVLLQRELSRPVLVARLFTSTLVFLNSSLNPILYCWKIREVRQAVKDIVKGLFCSSS